MSSDEKKDKDLVLGGVCLCGASLLISWIAIGATVVANRGPDRGQFAAVSDDGLTHYNATAVRKDDEPFASFAEASFKCADGPFAVGGCGGTRWAETVAAHEKHMQETRVFVNVGANKGYAIMAFLMLWTQEGVDLPRRWHRSILRYAQMRQSGTLRSTACGVCKDCQSHASHHKHERAGGRAHALELNAANRELLRWLANETAAAPYITIHDAAATNVSTDVTMHRNRARLVGTETNTICGRTQWGIGGACEGGGETVRAVALDDFAQTERLDSIYQVTIDTEVRRRGRLTARVLLLASL